MQVSVINRSKLHERLFRLDPDYYSPIFLYFERKIKEKRYKYISEICYVTDGEHGAVKTKKEGDIRYFGARNVLWGILENNNVEYITEEDHKRNKRSELKPDNKRRI